jgi:uroporphyrin-III C-methyltransferase / precorrin-2 dehydrogenase / sirohydrochlorin ferrochelatase
VVYMPKRTIAELAAQAMAHGLPAATPAVAIADATRPGETIVAGTVADIGGKLGEVALRGPVLVFIGRVFGGVAVDQDRTGIVAPSAEPKRLSQNPRA